jgi:16S rRNA processing protein RimM
MTGKQLLEAGKIINTQGLQGEVKVQAWADSAEDLLPYTRFVAAGEELKVAKSRVQKGFLYLRFEDKNTIEDVIPLKGKVLHMYREDLILPEGVYLLSDIIGSRVVDEEGNDIGVVEDILERPAANVYVIRGDREILVPSVPEFIKNVDTDEKIVTVRLIEGM